jgi:predicted ABC-type exoprotein transport system permease subunit
MMVVVNEREGVRGERKTRSFVRSFLVQYAVVVVVDPLIRLTGEMGGEGDCAWILAVVAWGDARCVVLGPVAGSVAQSSLLLFAPLLMVTVVVVVLLTLPWG